MWIFFHWMIDIPWSALNNIISISYSSHSLLLRIKKINKITHKWIILKLCRVFYCIGFIRLEIFDIFATIQSKVMLGGLKCELSEFACFCEKFLLNSKLNDWNSRLNVVRNLHLYGFPMAKLLISPSRQFFVQF